MLIMFCFAGAVILFANLGNIYLWQDEAETAVLARNTLEFGVPRAFDGTNLITNIYEDPCMYRGWKYAAWLQFYLVALCFRLIRESTFAARLPFAIFGVGSIALCYLLAERLFQKRFISRASAAFMLFSAPFFLYMRQCRWYALTVFFTLWLLISYLDLMEKKRFSAWGFILSGIFLFHSNYGIFFPVFFAVSFHYIVFHRKAAVKIGIKEILCCCLAIAVFTLPFLLYLGSMEYGGHMSFLRTKGHLEFYIRVLNKYLLPFSFLLLSLAALSFFKKKISPILGRPADKSRVWLLILVFIFSIGFLLLADERQLRYIVHLLPLSCIIMAVLIAGWLKVNAIAAALLFAMVSFTNVFHTGSPFAKKLWIPLTDIVYELTHDYDGPTEGIVKFLDKNARPGDAVKLIMGDYAVIFYTTGLKVDNGDFTSESYPEWIIVRSGWVPFSSLSAGYRKRIESEYQKIELDYPDILWENRPDPGYHKFRTVTSGPKVTVYRKR